MQSRGSRGEGKPKGIITSTIFILSADLASYDTLHPDKEVNFTDTLLYNKALED